MRRDPKAPRLLTIVKGKPHASSDDHVQEPTRVNEKPTFKSSAQRRTNAERSLPTPDSLTSSQSERSFKRKSMEDFDRDPESSSEAEHTKVSSSANSSFRKPATLDTTEKQGQSGSKKGFKVSGSSQASAETGKRDSSFNEDDEPDWLPRKKRKGLVNIFAPTVRPRNTYGSQASPRRTATFQKTTGAKAEKSPEKPIKFKALSGLVSTEGSGPVFKSSFSSTATPAHDDFQDLDDTSSLSSLDAEDLKYAPLPESNSYSSVCRCDWCEEEVPRMAYEEFLDAHVLSEPLPYKWKARFCRHHKRERAEEIRIQKGYPDVNWSRIGGRMRKHDTFLIDVLNDATESHYRNAQRDKLQQRSKFKADDDRPGACVGYYGPKGAKLMTDHIMESLSDQLRERATMDKLMSSSGWLGGVTGFIQAVLVPHLAELLIKDDMRLKGEDWSQKARDIISETAEMGELLHPEAGDKIAEDIDLVSDDDE